MVNRFKSKVVWGTIASLVLLVIGELGLWNKIGITESSLRIIIDSLLSILVLVGILNNPTNNENF